MFTISYKSYFVEILAILFLLCGKMFWKRRSQHLQPSGQQLPCVKVAVLFWLFLFCFVLRFFYFVDAAGGDDGRLLCLLICDSVGPATGAQAATLPPAGHPKDWDKGNRLFLVNFVLKAETLRSSFFSEGCETEEPAAPPTPRTTPLLLGATQ